jgi:hypothetical protein
MPQSAGSIMVRPHARAYFKTLARLPDIPEEAIVGL